MILCEIISADGRTLKLLTLVPATAMRFRTTIVHFLVFLQRFSCCLFVQSSPVQRLVVHRLHTSHVSHLSSHALPPQ